MISGKIDLVNRIIDVCGTLMNDLLIYSHVHNLLSCNTLQSFTVPIDDHWTIFMLEIVSKHLAEPRLPCPGGFPGGFGLQYLRCRCLGLDKRKICLWPMENLVLTNTSLEFWGYD